MTLRNDYVLAIEDENATLRERIAALEQQLGMTAQAPIVLGLSGQEERIFSLLVRRAAVSKEAAMEALYGHRGIDEEAEPKIVDVFVCKLRKKLKPFGIVVETQWGRGWFMPAPSKTLCAALMPASEVAA